MGKRKRFNTVTRNRGNSSVEVSRYLVDVVIPVYNRLDLLDRCLSSLEEAFEDETGKTSFRVYLVDNGSTEETTKEFYGNVCTRFSFPIHDLRLGKNTGFPYACNFGARKGTSPFLFFLNSDVVLDAGSARHLTQFLASNPKAGAVGMKLLFPNDVAEVGLNSEIRPAGKVQHVGLFTDIRANFFHIFSGWSADNPKVNALTDVHAVTGAALMTTRKMWNSVGGFYEGYGRGTYEDVEFCMEIHRMGYNILVDTKATGVHYTGATAETYKVPYALNENRNIFMARWGSVLVHSDWKAW